MKLIPKYEYGDKIIKYSGTNIYNKNGQDYIVEHKSPNDIQGYNKDLANYYITLPEVTVTSKRKTLPNDLASSLSKAASLGIVDMANPLNALSLSNYIGTGRRIINGEPIGKTLIEGSNGAFSDKVNKEHPTLSFIGNIILDSAIPSKLLSSKFADTTIGEYAKKMLYSKAKLPTINAKVLTHNISTGEVAPLLTNSTSDSRVIKVPKFLDTFSDKVINYIKKPLQNTELYKNIQDTKLNIKAGNLKEMMPDKNYEYNFLNTPRDYINSIREKIGTAINIIKNPSDILKNYYLAKYDRNIKEASKISSDFYNKDVKLRKFNTLEPYYERKDKPLSEYFDLFSGKEKGKENWGGYFDSDDKYNLEPSVHISKKMVDNKRELSTVLTHEFNHFGNTNKLGKSSYEYVVNDKEKDMLDNSYIFDNNFLKKHSNIPEGILNSEKNASNRELRQAISYDNGNAYYKKLDNIIDALDDKQIINYLKQSSEYTRSFYRSIKDLDPNKLHEAINKIKETMKYVPAVAGGAIGVNQIKKANH